MKILRRNRLILQFLTLSFSGVLWATTPVPLKCAAALNDFENGTNGHHDIRFDNIQNDLESVSTVRDQLLEWLNNKAKAQPHHNEESWRSQKLKVLLIAEEFLVNSVIHGGKLNPNDGERYGELDPNKRVSAKIQINDAGFDFTVRDQGIGYNPMNNADPTLPENLENPDGRGLLLALSFSNAIDYEYEHGSIHTFHFGWEPAANDARPFDELRKAKLRVISLPPVTQANP